MNPEQQEQGQPEEVPQPQAPEKKSAALPEQVLKPAQFALLSLVTGGIYLFWWQYKMWVFLRDRYGMKVLPAPRALLNSIFPIFVLPLFVNLAGRAQQRGYSLDFSPLLFSFAYLAIFFAHFALPAFPVLLLLLFVPCLPLIRIHEFLVLSDGIPAERAQFLHKSDAAVVLISLGVNLLAAWWLTNGGASMLGLG